MAILKRINKYQGLKDIDVLVEESGLSSQYFNIYDIPTNIPQGRSSFLLAGSPFLKNFVELKVEILDSAGQTIYTEPIANYLEGNARRVSIEVYDDTAPGDGFLYIVGELKDNYRSVSGQTQDNVEITDSFLPAGIGGNDVPPDFQNIYNVRYIRPIYINTTIPNTEPIFFYQQPRVTVNEVLKGYVVETTVSSSYEVTGSVSVDPIQGLEPKDPDPDPIDGFGTGMSDGARDEVGRQLEVFKNRRKNKIDPLRNNRFSKAGRLTRRASPEIDRFTINVDKMETSPENTTSDSVTSAFVGGEITINNPTVDSTQYPSAEYTIPSQYKSSIKKVNNEKTLVPLEDFVITKKSTGEKIPAKIEETSNNVTMSVLPTPPQTISTTHFRSYADITVGNLHTFSGDVYKAKIYARSKGTLGDFEPVYDASIESPQVLIDAYSPTGFKNTGYFYTQSIVDNYWVTSSNSTATQDNSQFIDGVLISGSNAGFTPKNSTVNTAEFNSSHSYSLETSVPYTVEFNAYYYKENKSDEDGNVTKQAELEVYLSGSALTGGTEDDYTLGKVVVGENQNEGQALGVHNTFTSAGAGTPSTHLKFKAISGRWIIQDIMLRPHAETNFNPTYFRTIVPMDHPLPKKPDDYDFLVEFYDLNNNIAETISVSEDNTFAGAPQNIDGEDNLLSGSLFIGNKQGSGFEMAGASSAYIRSLTYEGFDKTIASSSGGFLMWSGSVGGRLSSSEDYDGVGLEIVDAHGSTDRYLQFRTDPSTFKVQTDEFFLGSSTQFVSGSDGNIEISSSNFHLTPEGDVTMSGTITATAGNIGDWTISGGDIVGSNITLDADSSRIYKTDDNGELDGYYMDFTPGSNYYIRFGTNFAVNSTGTLIASGAVIEGVLTSSEGFIANWTIGSDAIYKLTDTKYSGLSSTGNTRFFAGASSLAASGSAPFNVTPTGQITGSDVLFTGGKIAGWTINGNALQGGTGGTIRLHGGNQKITIHSHTFGNEGIQMDYNGGDPRFYVGDGSNDYIKYDGSGVDIRTEKFVLDTANFDVTATGQITGSSVLFTGGKIGGFQISTDGLSSVNNSFQVTGSTGQVSGSQVFFDGGKIGGFVLTSTELYSLDSGTPDSTPDTGITIDTTGGGDSKGVIRIYDGTTVNAALGNWTSGKYGIYAIEGLIGGWTITSTELYNLASGTPDSSPDTGMTIDTTGGSNSAAVVRVYDGTTINAALGNWASGKYGVYAIEGDIGGWEIDSNRIFKSNIELNSNNSIIAVGNATYGQAGVQLQYDSAGKFYAGDGSNRYVKFDGTDVEIKSRKFELNTDTLDISSTNRRIQIFDTDGSTEYVRIGEVSTDASDKFGLKIYDGSGTTDSNTLVKLGEDGNRIAGWTINQTSLSSNNIFIHSEGTIETADFASNVKGWRISSDGNGTAEFENIRIRGTLATAVFEKETVNAVGGQLYVANSTSITGSASMSISETTMSVVNVTGFVANEVISAKKVHDTGFQTEYMLVNSASRDDSSSDTNFAGKLMVTRAYGSGSSNDFVGDLASASQSYEQGQVVVSTGVSGSGYIRLNANPNDTSTPYMDIVERTGSGIFDIEHKVRVGDLSGLSAGKLYGETNPGFGLYGENVFLSGSITATSGSFKGRVHINTSPTQEILMGTNVNSTHDGFYLNNNNYWYTSGEFRLGDATNYFHVSGTESSIASNVKIKTEDFNIDTSTFDVSTDSGGKVALGTLTGVNPATTNRGLFASGSGEVLIKGGTDSGKDYLLFNSSGMTISVDDIDITATEFDLSSTNLKIDNDHIHFGTITSDTDVTGAGFYASSSGVFRIQGDASNYLRISSGNFQIATSTFNLTGTNMALSNESMSLGTITTATDTSGAGVYMDNDGVFRVQGDSSNYLRVSSSAIDMAAESFNLDAGSLTLDSTNQQIRFADDASGLSYQGTGVFIGKDSGVYKMSLKSASGGSLSWDGAGGLAVEGTITITNFHSSYGSAISGSIAGQTGSLDTSITAAQNQADAGVSASAAAQNTANTGVSASLSAQGAIDTMETQVVLDSGGMGLWSSGGVASGYLVADYGTTSRFYDGVDDQAANVKLQLQAAGIQLYGDTIYQKATLDSSGLTIYDDQSSAAVDVANFSSTLRIGEHHASKSALRVDGSGNLTIGTSGGSDAVSMTNTGALTITGQVTATSGAIGGWTLDGTSGIYKLDSGTPSSSPNNGITIENAGGTNSKAVIRVYDGTTLNAALGNFASGKYGIYAIEGQIGGWVIGSSFIANNAIDGEVRLSGAANNGYLGIGVTSYDSNDGIWLGEVSSGVYKFSIKNSDGSKYLRYTDSAFEIAAGNFTLDSSGDITATSVDLTGDITATSGKIAGWDINGNQLNSTNDKVIIDGNNNNGELRMGASPPSSATSGTGIYLGGNGTFLVGSSSGNRIQYTSAGSIVLQSNAFALNTNTINIDSGVNSGTIKLGVSGGPTATSATNAGAYIDGTGKFNFVGGAGASLKYSSAGLQLTGSFDSTATITGGNIKTTNTRAAISSSVGLFPVGSDLGTLQDTAIGTSAASIGSGIHDIIDQNEDVDFNPTFGIPIRVQAQLQCTSGGTEYGRVQLAVSQSTTADGSRSITDSAHWPTITTYTWTSISKTDFDNDRQAIITPISGVTAIRCSLTNLDSQGASAGSSGLSDSSFDTPSTNDIKNYKFYTLASQTVMNETGLAISSTSDYYTLLSGAGSVFTGNVQIYNDLRITGNPYKPGGGSWLSPSDNRIKNITDDFTDGLSVIQKITPLRYEYKYDERKIEYIGVIAQELEKVAPYAVSKVKSDEHGLDDMRVINESNITYLLINSVKELSKKIEDLEDEIRIIKTT